MRLSRDIDPPFRSGIKKKKKKKKGAALLEEGVRLLSEYQAHLAAQDTQRVLVVLQALDAARKDGTMSREPVRRAVAAGSSAPPARARPRSSATPQRSATPRRRRWPIGPRGTPATSQRRARARSRVRASVPPGAGPRRLGRGRGTLRVTAWHGLTERTHVRPTSVSQTSVGGASAARNAWSGCTGQSPRPTRRRASRPGQIAGVQPAPP